MITLQKRVHNAAMPDDWKLSKLRQVFKTRTGNKNLGVKEQNLLSLSYGKIKRKDINSTDGLLPASFETYQIVDEGNIVMRLTDLQNDKRSLRQGLVTERGIITSAYDALEIAPDHNSQFWYYALLALDLAKYYYTLGGGVRQSIKFDDFPNDWVYCPSSEEQKHIADFLDRETTRIDLLIEKKLKFSDLIKEQISATIQSKISGDADCKAEYPNGSPPGWQRRSIRTLTKEHKQGFYTQDDYSNHGLRLIRISDFSEFGELNSTNAPFVNDDIKAREFLLAKGDFVFARTGGAGEFAIFDSEEASVFASYLIRFRFTDECYKDFMKFFFLSKCFTNSIAKKLHGGVNQNLSAVNIKDQVIALPCKKEQIRIVQYLKGKIKSKRISLHKTSKTIELLKELRVSLITAAVTGQIDVKSYGKSGAVDRHLDQLQDEGRA